MAVIVVVIPAMMIEGAIVGTLANRFLSGRGTGMYGHFKDGWREMGFQYAVVEDTIEIL